MPEKSELCVTCHPSSGGGGDGCASKPPRLNCEDDHIAAAFCHLWLPHLDHHLPPAGNKSRSVDSMSHSHPTFNLQLLSQRANFSTTSHVTWGRRRREAKIRQSSLHFWLIGCRAFYLKVGRSGLLGIGEPALNNLLEGKSRKSQEGAVCLVSAYYAVHTAYCILHQSFIIEEQKTLPSLKKALD